MAERIPPVLLVGNDIHPPLNEMAGWQVENIRSHFSLAPEQVVSLQSRKQSARIPPDGKATETVVPGNPSAPARLAQIIRLLHVLVRTSREQSRIIHFIGNGNSVLRLLLSLFAKLTGRALVLSPLGRLRGPWPRGAVIIVPHRSLLPSGASANWHIVPPFAPNSADSSAHHWGCGKLLFCSVPPKESELEERGIPLLLDIWREAAAALPDCSLTILNRYPWMTEPLERLVSRTAAERVSVRTEHVDDIEEYLREFSILVVPSVAPHLAQVPQSALEACAAGVPCLVHRGVAFGADVRDGNAGAVFEDGRSFLAGVSRIRSDYTAMSGAARRLINERFGRAESFARLSRIYDAIEFPPRRAYHGAR